MATLPCRNPSCKSNGRPHPNCRCYGNMAEGGEVTHYCSEDRAHHPACEYFHLGLNQTPVNPSHSVAAYLMHQGFHGAIMMHKKADMEHYHDSVERGHKGAQQRIKAIFEKSDYPKASDYTKAHKSIEEWIDKGGIDDEIQEEIYKHHAAPQTFADGGEIKARPEGIKEHPISEKLPEHNFVMQGAKTRISQYLNGLKPNPLEMKLPFDAPRDQRDKKKKYKEALQIAANPMSVLDKIQKGTLNKQDVMSLKAMHPEVDDLLQQKLTEQITRDQLKGRRPSAKIRQGLSLFLGAPLSSEMTPQLVQAAQATFVNSSSNKNQAGTQTQGQKGQQPSKGRKTSKSALTKSDRAYLTGSQGLIARKQQQS